ncbi:carboxypeptidase regulatory-like domain-containing protein [Nostocaceae cyanobacterium CENA357]|uniref:Carboxypeptidase regulatory-like domain-containing protein n=1 Tax=Atlanticothrix silvestris CENA357 TaxID=1725252 RepID=A0A8J7HGA1_9CYAN|nr:carboxypeptidase regulatory-like domain-containing protein [Atlanticothrix silvestris]MBH8552480.1 carboxypeptidase regulatory-like domain-containing protein [Atlanticothrix silvestris CENA357]
MIYQPSTSPPAITIIQSENSSCKTQLDTSVSQEHKAVAKAIATPSPPETLPPEFATDDSAHSCKVDNENITAGNLTTENALDYYTKQLVAQSTTLPIVSKDSASSDIKSTLRNIRDAAHNNDAKNTLFADKEQKFKNVVTPDSTSSDALKTSADKNNPNPNTPINNILAEAKNLLVGVFINQQEVGSLQVIPEGGNLLIPLSEFAQIAGFTVESIDGSKTQLKTPLGVVTLIESDLRKINGITYISDILLKEKLLTDIELKTSDLALNVNLPWRRGSGESSNQAIDLKPEVRPPSSGFSNLRQELNYYSNSGNTNWRSSTLLGGRLAGGAWRLRLENDFVNQPQLSEYFYFKRSGQLLYQIGRQQIGFNPLATSLNFTGAQIGYTNLPADRFNTNYSATELLPRRSQAVQTFRGLVPPASFVQLRVGGIAVAQQQVGLSGEYEFLDINLPTGQSNEIELFIFDRNNFSVPAEIRSLRLNASDLLLPSGGNVQLAGIGVTGNYIQNNLLDDFSSTQSGRFTGFYQVRQGISDNLTLESSVQLLPETTQAQAGFAWRLANPVILSANVGTSRGELGYAANLDIQLDRLQILGVSELYPTGYFNSINNNQLRDRTNNALDVRYKFSNNFNLGFIARSYQNQNESSTYILPTFSFRPLSNLSLRGTPDYLGNYSLNAFYQPTSNSRLSFNSFGNVYTTDFGYNLNRDYLLSFGTESGGDLATRFTLGLNYSSPSLSGLSWRLGLGYRDGEIGPVVGASMRVLPGLFARVDYQGIPSRNRNIIGGIGDDRLTISLVSDLSFAGGRISPAEYSSVGKDRGAIAGRMMVEGGSNGADLSGGLVHVYNNRGRNVGSARIDAQGNFFVGNLREGNYVVQLDPDELPIEIALRKTSIVAEVAGAAVTKLDFPVRLEYGMAGKITDVTGQPMSEVEVELINAEGKRVSTTMTDQFGLYRLDGVPVGNYTLRVPAQEGITNGISLPNLQVAINKDFVYDQNLKLPIAAAAKEIKENEPAQKP